MAQAAMIAGGAAQVVGQLRQGQMNAQMADYNSAVATQNQAAVEAQARENSRRSLIQNNKVLGSQRAGFAASGVSGGSVFDVLEDTAVKGELDSITIKNQAEMKIGSLESEKTLDKYRAKNELLGSYFSAAGALASTGAALKKG